MSWQQIMIEYVLVYSTSNGLTALGEVSAEPPHRTPSPHDSAKPPLPVYIPLVLVTLYFTRWTLSFLLSYLVLLTLTVVAVSTHPISIKSAILAKVHPLSQLHNIRQLILRIRYVGAFSSARSFRRRRSLPPSKHNSTDTDEADPPITVADTKRSLLRRASSRLHIPKPQPPFLRQLASLPYFRGLIPLTNISIAQWLLSNVLDFLISGQPPGQKLGYGSTSLILRTVFAQTYAVWTHYTITKPSNKRVLAHFPQGGEVLSELWPLTLVWSVSEHVALSLPLALSRMWGLRAYAVAPERWNELGPVEVKATLGRFAVVWALHLGLVALFAIPATIVARRVYASMLSDEDMAIVPLLRGKKTGNLPLNRKGEIKRPGLKIGEAWMGRLEAEEGESHYGEWPRGYGKVLRVALLGWLLQQGLHIAYWVLNWYLVTIFDVGRYRQTKLPWYPVDMIRLRSDRQSTSSAWNKSEL